MTNHRARERRKTANICTTSREFPLSGYIEIFRGTLGYS